MRIQKGDIAVITGAASGFGREFARIGLKRGLRMALVDVQQDALDATLAELQGQGAEVFALRCDVSQAAQVQALAEACCERYGVPNLVFNNAGVGGGLIWETSEYDWQWGLGVNLMGVAHGVRAFVPRMLERAAADPGWYGHVVNTASMAGLVNVPLMGVYNASKHAVVSLSETLYQDLSLVTDRIGTSVLCPYFVPTGIHQSERNRPDALRNAAPPTRAQRIAQANSEKAVTSGKLGAEQVAQRVFDAIEANRFYIYSHPQALAPVQARMEDVLAQRNPTDPFAAKPEVRERLVEALKGL